MKIQSNELISKKVFFWNTFGSILSAGSSFILLMFVTRLNGEYGAGAFSIAFATAQLLLAIGRYGMRAYQATDINENYSFTDYFSSRIITCTLMIISCIIYIFISKPDMVKGSIIFWVCIIKLSDALEDIFHGQLQQKGRMDVAGQLLVIRNVFTILIFISCLIYTKNLLITCLVTGISSLIFCFILNLLVIRKLLNIKLKYKFNNLKELLYDCLPLFAGTFLSLYIYNVPKYAIDRYMAQEFQTYYGIIFMPSFIINLFSEFIFKPLLNILAVYWNSRDIKKFIRIIIKQLGIIAIIGIVVIIGAFLLGIPILSFLYNVNLNPYKIELIILLLGGCFGAASYLMYNVLTSMRKQLGIFIIYLIIAIVTTIISPIFVKYSGIFGASIAYLMCSGLLFFNFFLFLLINVRKNASVLNK